MPGPALPAPGARVTVLDLDGFPLDRVSGSYIARALRRGEVVRDTAGRFVLNPRCSVTGPGLTPAQARRAYLKRTAA